MYAHIGPSIVSLLAFVWLVSHSVNAPATPIGAANEQGIVELEWDDLIPADYNPYKIREKYDTESLVDGSPEATKLLEELRSLWSSAPVVKELDGLMVKLPGFVVPLQHDGDKVSEFLLVPYFGACIHVPPPPSNQTVYVTTEEGQATKQALFDTVWVTGKISAEWTGSEMGDAGYTLQASEVVPYQ